MVAPANRNVAICGGIYCRAASVLGAGESERRKLWGNIINPNDAIADFDPRYISDGQLGAP
jgi:hypothetical protein